MAYNKKTLENLVNPIPGEVRNPNGRPKGSKNRATVLKSLLKIKIKQKNPLKDGKEESMTVEQVIELALIKKGMQGDVRAITLISEKMYGKIPLDINLGGQEDRPLRVEEKKIGALSFEELYELKYGKKYKGHDQSTEEGGEEIQG